MKLLILALGIASCGIGWGQEKPLPECTSKLVDGVWVIADIPAKGCVIRSECEGDGCPHKPVPSAGLVKVAPLVAHEPEALDVPAIMEDYLVHRKNDLCSSFEACYYGNDQYGRRPGCADKTRILEHDEQTPPKFYCRKPQTGDHQ